MPRTARASVGGAVYHVINRGNQRATVYHSPPDYAAFLQLVERADERIPMRLLAYCLMPNHFHLVLWPHEDGDLSRWMQWLLTAHVRRYHRVLGTSGRVWQGRFKAFPVQSDGHLLAVLRYVEANPLRAGLVRRAEEWAWSSAAAVSPAESGLGGSVQSGVGIGVGIGVQSGVGSGLQSGLRGSRRSTLRVDEWPVPRPADWLQRVNEGTEPPDSLRRLRECVNRGAPYGDGVWVEQTAARLGLESSLRPPGRPRHSG